MNDTPKTMECSHCGEIRTHGQPHDDRRCSIISHAIVAVGRGNPSEAARHIVELSRWLADHPKQRGTQQYTDREISLERWITKAQQLIATK